MSLYPYIISIRVNMIRYYFHNKTHRNFSNIHSASLIKVVAIFKDTSRSSSETRHVQLSKTNMCKFRRGLLLQSRRYHRFQKFWLLPIKSDKQKVGDCQTKYVFTRCSWWNRTSFLCSRLISTGQYFIFKRYTHRSVQF